MIKRTQNPRCYPTSRQSLLLPSPSSSAPCDTILPQSLTFEASQQHHQPYSRQPAAGRLLLSSFTAASSR